MPNTPISRHTASVLAKSVLIGMAVQILVISYVFVTEYLDRKDMVSGQRAGCERNKLDRKDNAEGWRIAQDARWASGDVKISIRYGKLAKQLQSRSHVDCAKLYPEARLVP